MFFAAVGQIFTAITITATRRTAWLTSRKAFTNPATSSFTRLLKSWVLDASQNTQRCSASDRRQVSIFPRKSAVLCRQKNGKSATLRKNGLPVKPFPLALDKAQ